jgi:hypothetical protein
MSDELQPATSLLPDLRCFVLVVGNARSGSTLLGAALDGHPRTIVSNEAGDSMSLWRGLTRDEVLARIVHRAGINHGKSRASADYLYQIGPPPAEKQGVLVAGDKTWNPTLLLLHGNPELLASLEDRLAVPVRLVYAIRNPFDVIATMHRRSAVSVRDRIRWYFMHCEAAEALPERLPRERWLESHHVDLLTDLEAELHRIGDFLGLPRDADHVAAVRAMLFERPRRTAEDLGWHEADVARDEFERALVARGDQPPGTRANAPPNPAGRCGGPRSLEAVSRVWPAGRVGQPPARGTGGAARGADAVGRRPARHRGPGRHDARLSPFARREPADGLRLGGRWMRQFGRRRRGCGGCGGCSC